MHGGGAVISVSTRGIVIVEFSERRANTLRGFAKVGMPSGMVVHEYAIHVANGRAWASPPARPMMDRSGVAMRDDAGKIRYSPPLISFTSKEIRDRFSDAVIEAMRIQFPDALAEGGES
jgi:hypothetical protein